MNIDFARTEFGKEEREAVQRVLSGYWFASGPENEAFEKEFAAYAGTKHAVCVNSGSSANLIGLTALGLPKGARVLTPSCGFPATLAPIIHLGLEPVLVDYDLESHNMDVEAAIRRMDEVQAAIFAHTLGNPVDVRPLVEAARKRGVALIEDCCEAVGARVDGRSVGSFGAAGTFSFYPAHQITAFGGGGMIVTDDDRIARECRSLRDWGKVWDWDDTLGDHKTRYTEPIDGIRYYRHYTYQTVGYNAKLPEPNAAFGRAQLKRLDGWVKRRGENFAYFNEKVRKTGLFVEVRSPQGAEPSWFGFPLTLKGEGHPGRDSMGDWLESQGVRTRPFFAGNITRHKPFRHLFREFPAADKLMRDGLFVGIWQGLGKEHFDYMAEQIERWAAEKLASPREA